MKYKILEILQNSEDYISGQALADDLNVTRTAIWKNISALKDEGYDISSVSNKGYMLKGCGDVLNSYEIEHNIKGIENFKCIYCDSTPSTNDLAKKYAAEGCDEWLIVTCKSQTSGKGRLGRQWIESGSDGIYMSVVLKPEITPMEATQITLITGISVLQALKEITGLELSIKWPNDIVINGKKVAGILTEMSAEVESVKYIVTGIGVNVNQSAFPEEISHKAASIFSESKKKYRRSELICCIINKLEKNYNIFCRKGFTALKETYIENCINIGKKVRAVKNKAFVEGTAVDISDTGEIVIKTEDNQLINISSGEVSLRGENNNYI